MMRNKTNLVIGMTTFNNEMLRVSVPALGRLVGRVHVIIFNDNPTTTLTRRDIRRMGYGGDLTIINSDANVGMLGARMGIIDEIARMKNPPEWTMFVDDDDILIDASVPTVASDNFAILQNALVLRRRVCDLMRAMTSPRDLVADGECVTLNGPNLGMCGTMVRTKLLIETGAVIKTIIDEIHHIDDGLNFRAPTDAMMWTVLNTYARHVNPNAVPIYMDTTNYISVKMDSAVTKYGRPARPVRNAADYYARAIARYNAAFCAALNAAAPRGNDNN